MTVAVLITLHNEKQKTWKCLTNLHQQTPIKNTQIHTYATCDQCTDGTNEELPKKFPWVQTMQSSHPLFWGGGTNLSWNLSVKTSPDYYLLLNQDTYLEEDAIKNIMEISQAHDNNCLVVGKTCCPQTGQITYGGRQFHPRHKGYPGSLVDSPQTTPVAFANGNILLIPKQVFKKIGMISPHYPHRFGDFDYSRKANKLQIPILLSGKVLGKCEKNQPRPPHKLWRERLFHPIHGDALAYLRFLAENAPELLLPGLVKSLAKATFPQLYEKSKRFLSKNSPHLKN